MKPKQSREVVCGRCGKTFETTSGKQKYCEACKKRKQRDTQITFLGKRDGREVYTRMCVQCGLSFNTFFEDRDTCTDCIKSGRNPAQEAIKPTPVPLTLAEQMREIDAYNREHGTQLSYGKYMAMIRAKEGEARVVFKP